MAITQAVCNSFKVEILKGLHNFTATTGNAFKLALYDNEATLKRLRKKGQSIALESANPLYETKIGSVDISSKSAKQLPISF